MYCSICIVSNNLVSLGSGEPMSVLDQGAFSPSPVVCGGKRTKLDGVHRCLSYVGAERTSVKTGLLA